MYIVSASEFATAFIDNLATAFCGRSQIDVQDIARALAGHVRNSFMLSRDEARVREVISHISHQWVEYLEVEETEERAVASALWAEASKFMETGSDHS
jgi:hypothetical protein